MIRILILLLTTVGLAGAAEPALKIFRLDSGVACVRATSVTETLMGELQVALTNPVAGLVLDLRFAGGNKNISNLDFLSAQKSPFVVLVNPQTHGAAADLAAQLRSKQMAFLIGGKEVTGKIAPDITLAVTSEQEKKFQQDPFTVLNTNRVTADTKSLLPFIDHTSEADLVRRRLKDGEDAVVETPRAAPEQRVIRDPALARALDLYKALAVLKPARG